MCVLRPLAYATLKVQAVFNEVKPATASERRQVSVVQTAVVSVQRWSAVSAQ